MAHNIGGPTAVSASHRTFQREGLTVLDKALAIGERLAGLPPQALRASKVAMNTHPSRAALGVGEYAPAEE